MGAVTLGRLDPDYVRRTVVRLFWLGLAVRAALALFLHFWVADDNLFAPDQRTYHAVGKFLSDVWSQEAPVISSQVLPDGPKGYFYIVAAIYYVVGPYSLFPKLLNCLVGALTILVAHDLALRMGASSVAALRAAKLTTWFPSLVLWSSLNIRDAWIILLIALMCRQALVLQSRFRPTALLTLAGGLLLLVQFRAYLLFAIGAPILVSFFAIRSRNFLRSLIVGSIVAVALIYADQAAGRSRQIRFVDFEELHEIRYWNTVGASSQFEQVDISTPGKALAYLPRGMALFLLAPFPWMIGSIRQVLAVPETLFFYWLIPWVIRGARDLLKADLTRALLAVLITSGLTLGYSLGEGNAGTAYRHRAQILTFFLIFAAAGLDRRYARRQVVHPPALPRVA
jgi:hypothetical protein